MSFPWALVKESEIADAVMEAERELAPHVVRIRYNVGENWTGDPAVFFRVLLSDRASRPKGPRNIARRVEAKLEDDPRVVGPGLFAYFNYRSESEQAKLKDKAWS